MPAPPQSFVDELHRRDPELRVRWGVRCAQWMIERKMPPRHRQYLSECSNPWKSPRGLDLYDGWREGYVHIVNVHRDRLVWAIVAPELDRLDGWKQGGFAKISAQLDEIDAREDAKRDRDTDAWAHEASLEAYDRLAWLQGRRIAVPGDASGVATSDVIEQHEGFTVRLRKRAMA